MMRPRLPPASWLLLLAAAATQCPDTDETLDLRVVLSDAQGFRRNDVRWSLSAAASMDAYAAGALVGSGNATLDAGAVKQWSGWCEDQCKPPSGSPQNCLTPEMTGAAACVCGGAGAEE